MKTKIIPFNLETAKKIQAGEIEGRIVTYSEKHPVRIIAYDILGGYKVVYAQLIGDIEVVGVCNESGIAIDNYKALAIELPEETPHFKPFDKVLGKSKNGEWVPDMYSRMTSVGRYICLGGIYEQILPYEDHEYLVGTTDNPKED